MRKFYTENKEMYFEVQESEASIYSKENKVFTIHAFYKNGKEEYNYERQIPEDIFFNHQIEAETVAESLSWAFNWGVDVTAERMKDCIVKEITNVLDKI